MTSVKWVIASLAAAAIWGCTTGDGKLTDSGNGSSGTTGAQGAASSGAVATSGSGGTSGFHGPGSTSTTGRATTGNVGSSGGATTGSSGSSGSVGSSGSTGSSTGSASGSSGTTTGGTLHATAQPGPANGWQLLGGGAGLPGRVNDASADEGGNIWVAGGQDGLFLMRAGSANFQRFGTGDGLHPYGYPSTGSVTQVYLNVLSVAGGAAGHAYVGYDGVDGCEDEWDQHAANPDPNIYKSGDADHVWLSGSGIQVAHYDIYTGPNVVASEARGREKLCSIYRLVYDGAHGNVWVGANHGYAWLNPGYSGSPFYAGDDSPQVLQEHAHPAISGYVHDDAPPQNDFLLTGGYYGLALEPSGAVWVGGIYRTYRCNGGNGGANFWGCESDDNAMFGHQIDIWPDAVQADAYPRQRVDDYVMGLAVMPDGTVWAAARDRQDDTSQAQALGVGLAHLTPGGAVLGYMTDALLSPNLSALAADVDGTLWVGSEAGLMRFDPSRGVMYQFGGDALGGFAGGHVTNIQVDRHSNPRRVLVSFANGGVAIYSGN